MPCGHAHQAMAVVDTAPPRPLKAVNQKLGRLFGISKQVDPLDSFLFLEPPSDYVQSLPPLPERLAANTTSFPSPPKPRPVRVVGRGGAGSRPRMLAAKDIKPRPLISRQQTCDSQASSSSTSSSTSSETIRYGGRGGAGRACIIKSQETKPSSSSEADGTPFPSTQSNRNARIFDDISPTSTVTDYLPTPTDPVFPPNPRRPQPLVVIAQADEDGVIYRMQPPLPSPMFWKKPFLVNVKKRDDSSDFFDRLPLRNDPPIELPPRAASSLQIRRPEMPVEEPLMTVENSSSEQQHRCKSWNGEWNEEVQNVINKLRKLH